MTMLRNSLAVSFAVLLLFGCRGETAAQPDAGSQGPVASEANDMTDLPDDEEAAELMPVTITTDSGEHVFRVEVARTPAEQTRGLMFREALPDDGGMLFPFDRPIQASFWMRNTMIPLDMLFIREDGTIANIERETEPYTLDQRRSDGLVIAVLELDGGKAAELGIDAGDRVSWPDGPRNGRVEIVE